MSQRILTGITTTGTPHLGNYAGMLRPAIAASRRDDTDSFFFLADYHALIKCDDPERIARSRLEIAATWLACGLDPARVTFYRQSDIPEIPELTWILTCVTAKGLLNRAHAYKDAVDQNTAKGEDADAAVTAGLYMYPVLMAADILAFNANAVPVGRDQVQHVEMTRDIGQRFNHIHGAAWRAAGGKGEPFALPEAVVEESVATLPGLDGRKMSKSYDNTIPLFEGGPKATREAIAKIVTDSREPGEPKDPDSSSLFAIFRAFAGDAESTAFREELESGLGWGNAKKQLSERIEREIAPLRERYDALMVRPDDIEDVLREGASKARAIAQPRIETMRRAVGLGALGAGSAKTGSATRKGAKRARIASFRDGDGFHFRVFAADGEELLLSRAFADPKTAGTMSKALLAVAEPDIAIDDSRFALMIDGERVATSPAFADTATRDAAVRNLRAALASLREVD
ncbi:MAG: tryptophan--tRNA ligase [Rhodanobacteraceae bacterium]